MSTIPRRTKGAWLIAHSLKLEKVDTQGQFTGIETAGKFGRALSLLSATNEQTISNAKLKTLAKANAINPELELAVLLRKMEERHLISLSNSGDVTVLGLTHGRLWGQEAMGSDLFLDTAETFCALVDYIRFAGVGL